MKFLTQTRHTLLSITLAVILSVLGGWFILGGGATETQTVSAGSTDNISGYAWIGTYDDSDGDGVQDANEPSIGWVSFNCTNLGENCVTSNYGVHIINDSLRFTPGAKSDLSGSAWNSTNGGIGIGWISFDRNKTGNPPSSDIGSGVGPIAQITWSASPSVAGWARVLAGCQDIPGTPVGSGTQPSCLTRIDPDGAGPLLAPNPSDPGFATGGWDGWIKLRSTVGEPNYGVTLNSSTNMFSGFAWGGDVVGWVKFASTGGEPNYGVVFTPIGVPPPPGCGTADGNPTASPPATNLCNVGSALSSPTKSLITPYKWDWTCDNGGTSVSCSAPFPQCSDGIDNDGDTKIDRVVGNEDIGCSNSSDNTERDFKFKEF